MCVFILFFLQWNGRGGGSSVSESHCAPAHGRVCSFFFISSYSDIIIEREVLMQKYIHLVQIVETEKVAANQLRTQLEDQDTEIERLKAEVLQQN